MKKLKVPFFFCILLLVMGSEEIVWHLGPHPMVNTACGEIVLIQGGRKIITKNGFVKCKIKMMEFTLFVMQGLFL